MSLLLSLLLTENQFLLLRSWIARELLRFMYTNTLGRSVRERWCSYNEDTVSQLHMPDMNGLRLPALTTCCRAILDGTKPPLSHVFLDSGYTFLLTLSLVDSLCTRADGHMSDKT